MKDTKVIRVRTSKHHQRLYADFKKQSIGDAHIVFFISACIGFSTGQKKSLGKDGDDRFFDHTIDPREMAVFQSMFLSENTFDLQLIQDNEKVLRFVEEYANGGMQHIVENIPGFEVQDSGECILKESEAVNLPQRLLSLIIQSIE